MFLKVVVFTGGLYVGLMAGISLREKGYTSALTKAYYAYKNGNPKEEQRKMESVDVDNLFEYYSKELLDEKDLSSKSNTLADPSKFDRIDKLILNEARNQRE